MSTSLLLTLKLDQPTFERANQLRQQHFPPERNVVPAHIMLFHQLPGDQETAIAHTLSTLCAQTQPFPVALPSLQFFGNGVAIGVSAPELMQLHSTLATTWDEWLIPQDRQGYCPHITIQNKVKPETARQFYEDLNAQWQSLRGRGEGLLLWYYRRGPWELAREFCFAE
ncbi:2'-5' RNA ligase family protein [Nodosilinea sp. PGN35]|uniref:2'-5' RNA ligase family protein n=1 Tax=Nodosilinea sp. PGN35 TaxID=3020489 RepID=UPI0023B27267|nr:2'-5' RNA ligase family protein [Nodosilinea sp. TSF1-S3]MDF0365091.1 2'-5' RNA ligase family protein [Nodosilinea sp. TSF1-S3]